MSEPIRIARLKRKTRVLGPGVRAVVWTSGCSRGCPGCVAAEMNRDEPRFVWSARELCDWVESIDGIDGVVVSGGEPFEQDLTTLAEFLRAIKNGPRRLCATLYTGKTLDELRADANACRVLNYVDLLIDGPYRRELDDGRVWRGSSNQNLIALNPDFEGAVADAQNRFGREIELKIAQDANGESRLELTGVPEKDLLDNLRRNLRENGYEMK